MLYFINISPHYYTNWLQILLYKEKKLMAKRMNCDWELVREEKKIINHKNSKAQKWSSKFFLSLGVLFENISIIVYLQLHALTHYQFLHKEVALSQSLVRAVKDNFKLHAKISNYVLIISWINPFKINKK